MSTSNARVTVRFLSHTPGVASRGRVRSTPSPGSRSFHSSSLPEIALTFDDGPNPVFTPQILHVLEHYGVKATFFCIGEQVQRYPDLLQQIQQAGDTIGVHGWDHTDLTKHSSDEIDQQLRSTSMAIQQATGTSPAFFRPPYGSTDKEVVDIASTLGLTQVLWTINTEDWQRPGVEAIVHAALTNVQNGSILLMHDGGDDRSETVEALPQVITGLQQRGFTFVTVEQLPEEQLPRLSDAGSRLKAEKGRRGMLTTHFLFFPRDAMRGIFVGSVAKSGKEI